MENIENDRLRYLEYLQSEAWSQIVAEAKRRANRRCQICNRHEDEVVLDGHHRTYERLGREVLEDITILCRDCHELYENKKRLAKYGGVIGNKSRSHKVRELLVNVIESIDQQKTASLPSGFTMLDAISGGWTKGQLAVIAGRPGVGKSSFVNTTCLNVARTQGTDVIYFSLQSSPELLTARFLSMETGVATHSFRTNQFDESQWPVLLEAAQILGNSPITFDDTPNLTPDLIRDRCYALLAEQKELALIVIDGEELISPNTSSGSWTRDTQIIVRELKNIARQLEVPVIVTATTDRTSEQRADKRPMLTDLPEPWLQIADVVLGLYREDYYIEDTDRPNLIDVMVMKNREGYTGVFQLYLDKEIGVLRNLEIQRISTEY